MIAVTPCVAVLLLDFIGRVEYYLLYMTIDDSDDSHDDQVGITEHH